MLIKVSEDLEDIFPNYLNERKNEVETLRQLVIKKDFEALNILGHRLSGNAASYGLPHLGSLGKKIELDASAQNSDHLLSYIDEIEKYLSNIEVEYIVEE